MAHQLNVKPPLPASPTSTGNLKVSTEADVKAKHLFHAFFVRHAGRLVGALAGARAALLGLLDAKACLVATKLRRRRTKTRNKGKQPCSFSAAGGGDATPTQYLNLLPDDALPSWSSPIESGGKEGGVAYYYDSSWNAMIPADQLPPIMVARVEEEEVAGCNDIDRLAERFIARCHERFMLEKQASFRRFQEMLARSF